MYRRIYFFGCSYTKGAGLADSYKERYSYHLSKLCSAQHRNFASHAGSDFLSLTQLLRVKAKGLITSEDLVVFQWTQSARHSIPIGEEPPTIFPDGNYENNQLQNLFHYPFVDAYTWSLGKDKINFLKEYTSMINPDAISFFNNNVLKELLTSWLFSNNIKFIQFSSHHHRVDKHYHNFIRTSMEEYTDKMIKTNCGHPGPDAHKQWANYLFQHLKNNLL
jgi:hypothetical protein